MELLPRAGLRLAGHFTSPVFSGRFGVNLCVWAPPVGARLPLAVLWSVLVTVFLGQEM